MRRRVWCLATRIMLPITRSNVSKVASFSELCKWNREFLQSVLEQKFQQAYKICQTCHFRNWGINQTQILSLPSLPFSESVPIKHTVKLLASILMTLQSIISFFSYYMVFQKNFAPFVWLLWRRCRFNFLGFSTVYRLGFNLEFETLYESIWPVVADFLADKRQVLWVLQKQHFYCSLAMSK